LTCFEFLLLDYATRARAAFSLMNRARVRLLVAVAAVLSPPYAYSDIECKVKADTMITQPGSFERAVTLVNHGKSNQARRYVHCLRDKGTRMFVTGKPKRGHEMFVPVTTGDCTGETYRPYLECPGDKRH